MVSQNTIPRKVIRACMYVRHGYSAVNPDFALLHWLDRSTSEAAKQVWGAGPLEHQNKSSFSPSNR